MKKVLFIPVLLLCFLSHGQIGTGLKNKTLVVWAALDNLEQRGGSALTIDDLDGKFDGIIFAENEAHKWMSGSDYLNRTQKEQLRNPDETAKPNEFVQIAIVYDHKKITIFRNGQLYASYEANNEDFPDYSAVVFGKRHIDVDRPLDSFTGRIKDARIYSTALSIGNITSMKPGVESSIAGLWAWWDFSTGKMQDVTQRFQEIQVIGNAYIKDGCLILPGNGASVIASNSQEDLQADYKLVSKKQIEASRYVRKTELNDPIRPSWHLTIPEGKAWPYDPNGAIFKDGVYHLWHIYQTEKGSNWQHLSSIDLFHWRWHAEELKPDQGSESHINSGNAFFAKDGKVVMSYNGAGTPGNCVAVSDDPELEHWTKPEANPIAVPGWDPHMWLEGDTYYMISGDHPLVPDDVPILFKGQNYDQKLTRQGDFLAYNMPGVDDFEDLSCPDFFKMDDKWVLVCISHIRGARYYIGDWDGKQFKPQSHHRMNWPGGTFFAPETLIDSKGRRVMWAWVLDRKEGMSSGTMSMPRVLTLSKDKASLNIESPKEIESLRYKPVEEKPFTVQAGQSVTLNQVAGNILELDITIDPGKAKKFGVKVFCSKDKREQTPVIIDLEKSILQIDMTKSSLDKPKYYEYVMIKEPNPTVNTQEAPFSIKKGEKINLRIFLDKSMLEVFANGKQCITQVIYPTLQDAVHVEVFSDDAPIKVEKLNSWQLFPAMQW